MLAFSLLRMFTDELPLKLLSLAVAVTLFVIVRTDKDAATSAYVKVNYILPEDRLLVSDPPSEVRVGLRGPWTRIQHFDAREIDSIRVDLTHGGSGELRFSEDIVKAPRGLRVVSLTPPTVRLEFEPRVITTARVQPTLEGEPAEGFRVARVTAQPNSVQLDGARRAVESIKSVPTEPLHIAGARSTIRYEVALQPPPRYVRFVDPPRILVEVELAPAIVERTVETPLRILGAGKLDVTLDPPAARVVLRGPSDVLARITVEQIWIGVDAQLEEARPPATYRKRVLITGLPSDVGAEVRPDTVTLTTHRPIHPHFPPPN